MDFSRFWYVRFLLDNIDAGAQRRLSPALGASYLFLRVSQLQPVLGNALILSEFEGKFGRNRRLW